MNREEVLAILQKKREVLDAFLVKNLYLFGSVARGDSQADSDVDILVDYKDGAQVGLFQFVRLQRELSKILGCRVDLATRESLHKKFRDEILKEAVHAA